MARLLPSLKSVVTQIIQWVSHHYCLVRSRPPFIPSVTSSSHPCPRASSSSLEEDITALPNSHTASQPACHYLLHTGSYSEASPSTLALAPALNPSGEVISHLAQEASATSHALRQAAIRSGQAGIVSISCSPVRQSRCLLSVVCDSCHSPLIPTMIRHLFSQSK